MKTLNDVLLEDILPDSITRDETVKGAAEAIDPQLRVIAPYLDFPSIYANFDRLTSPQLDHLAKQWDVTVWRDSWPVSLKRSVLKASIKEKRKKGTAGAVKKALESLGSSASIVEWWQTEPKGTPHTFTIYATQGYTEGVITSEMQEDIIAAIEDAKPLRSHYDFQVQQQARGGFNVCGFIRVLTYASVRPTPMTSTNLEGAMGFVTCARPIVRSHIIATTA